MDSTSLRLDHNFTQSFKVFGRYSGTPSQSGSRNGSNLAVLNKNAVNVRTATLGVTNILGSRLSNDARFNVTRNDSSYRTTFDNFGGATPLPDSSIPGLGSSDWFLFSMPYQLQPQIMIRPLTNRQRQTNITDSFTAVLGRHSLKTGFDYRRLLNSEYLPSVVQYGYFNGPASLQTCVADQVYLYRYSGAAKPVYTNFSLYVQDEWKTTRRLSLSLGLRWDVNPAPRDAQGNDPYGVTSTDIAALKLAPRGTPLWATAYRNFAPRIGAAYQLNRTAGRETVLRAGFGVFYDSGNAQGSQGYNGIGFYGQEALYGQNFPLGTSDISAGPTASVSLPYSALVAGFNPHLTLPRVLEWNVALEHSLGANNVLTGSYVGSAGRKLLIQKFYYPGQYGNINFAPSAGMYMTDNDGRSDYHALQLQYQRKLTRGLQMLASYAWSHSTDNASSNFVVYQLLHASSDFDVRHSLQIGFTYLVPASHSVSPLSILTRGWAFDGRIAGRSGFPVDIQGAYDIDPFSGSYLYYQPDRVAGQPLYVSDAHAPGGRKINYDAFAVPVNADGRPVQGNSGRNVARGFASMQIDLALRREFRIKERTKLQFRFETFNLLNHPIFGSIYSNRYSNLPAQFGVANNTQNSQLGGLNSLFQQGGPRSVQLALRLQF
jgi:hypothetical protein